MAKGWVVGIEYGGYGGLVVFGLVITGVVDDRRKGRREERGFI